MPYADPEKRRQKRREAYQATPVEIRAEAEKARYAAGKKERMAQWYKDNRDARLEYRRKYYAKNAEKIREQALARYHNDPEQKIRTHLKARYGLTIEQRDAIFASQNNCCAICGTNDPGTKAWHIDHCHTTGKVRGILCFKCNTGLGNFADSIPTLNSAAEYLRKHHHDTSNNQCKA